jgi:hypothetical protein
MSEINIKSIITYRGEEYTMEISFDPVVSNIEDCLANYQGVLKSKVLSLWNKGGGR